MGTAAGRCLACLVLLLVAGCRQPPLEAKPVPIRAEPTSEERVLGLAATARSQGHDAVFAKLVDGVVTQEEYESAVADARWCETAAGLDISEPELAINSDWQFGWETTFGDLGAAEAMAILDECENTLLGAVTEGRGYTLEGRKTDAAPATTG